MSRTIFFSWQADTPTNIGRNLVERALERALGKLGADATIEEADRHLEIDRDTKDVPGTPPIVETIFAKIDRAAIFLPDLTFVGQRLDGRPTPNPNVLIEYGWALKALGHGCMVPVMNTAFGRPAAEAMPFDMRHLRNPITYHCPETADEGERRRVRDELSSKLERAIRLILASPDRSSPDTPQPKAFPRHGEADRPGLFRPFDDPLGIEDHGFSGSFPIKIVPDPRCWLRVFPISDPGRQWSVEELQGVAWRRPILRPLNRKWTRLSHFRAHDGCGIFAPCGNREDPTYGSVILFKTGEIWSINSYISSEGRSGRAFWIDEADYAESLDEYASTLKRLGIEGPFHWIAGVCGVKELPLVIPQRPGYSRDGPGARGSCMLEVVTSEGTHDIGSEPVQSLRPFFERVYEACALTRPELLDVSS